MQKKIFILAGSILCLLLLVYLGISLFFTKHFYVNTEINGYDMSGKTTADAETYFTKQVEGYTLTIQDSSAKADTITGQEISLAYKQNKQLNSLLKKQNPFSWPVSLFSKKSAHVTIDLSYDEEAFKKAVQSLYAVTAKQTPSQSAQPEFDGNTFIIAPEVYGTAVDTKLLTEKLLAAIMRLEPKIDLLKEGCYAQPQYTSDSKEVKQACDTMNQYCQASITYPMDGPVIVDKALISKWLRVDNKMNVTFDDAAIKEWLTQFGERWDTVGTARTFTTPGGKNAAVSGGTYGWSIDEDTELETLKSDIQNKKVIEREPACYIGGTAASHGMPDWGNTFVDVDLSLQCMWYVKDGNIVLTTDVITGEPIPEKITPEGVYSLQDKKLNEVLVGSINPATGQPEYRTEVNHWMRITWDTGIGLHDAGWQSAFGGSLNQIPNVGSHGCINMPVDKAAELYDMIETGTPVIIHY